MTPRAAAMVARLVRAWRDAGLDPADVARLEDRAMRVMAHRSGRFADDHHPAFLHPLRSVLLLLEVGDVGVEAHEALLALDTEAAGGRADPDARVESEDLRAVLEASADERLEALLTAPGPVRRMWLVERLDQLRHLHLWGGSARTRAALERARSEEGPLATREGGRLATAWADWIDKAGRFRLVERAKEWPSDREPPGSAAH